MALSCGRRFGKTDLAKAWIKQGLVQGEACAWFAPQHKQTSEVFAELSRDLPAHDICLLRREIDTRH
jgi:hypothetical protein